AATAATVAAATAVTAAAATTVAAAAVATTATGTARRALTGLVHVDGTRVEDRAVHLLDRAVRRRPVVERHEPEAARPAGLAVGDHLGLRHVTETLEGLPQPLVRRSPAQTTHEKLLRHRSALSLLRPLLMARPGRTRPRSE